MSKKQVAFIGCIAFLVIFSIVNYIQLNKLSNQLDSLTQLEHNIQSLSSSMGDIHSTVSSTLQEFTEEQRWIRNSYYEVKAVDMEEEKVEVSVLWSLRNIEKDETLYLLFREQGSREWQHIELDETEDLSYHIDLRLSIKENYETQILAVSDDRKRSDDLQEISVFQQLEERIYADVYAHSVTNNQIDLHIMIQQLYGDDMFIQDKDRLEIKSALAYVYMNDELVKTVDVLENANPVAHMPHEEMYEYFESLKFDGEKNGVIRVDLIIQDGLGIEYKRESYDY
ncbi:hypothetical protein [Alkalihalobacterium alkalinitrilicum]|uniref:hypothetical protein n=1 Tax=Alkalihalobacterium alkalinitrilicum TaxID=427920 RepID=UPI000995D23B|nr:hypothetical protein [Alkalihalobacterium alkalinitrilicum]